MQAALSQWWAARLWKGDWENWTNLSTSPSDSLPFFHPPSVLRTQLHKPPHWPDKRGKLNKDTETQWRQQWRRKTAAQKGFIISPQLLPHQSLTLALPCWHGNAQWLLSITRAPSSLSSTSSSSVSLWCWQDSHTPARSMKACVYVCVYVRIYRTTCFWVACLCVCDFKQMHVCLQQCLQMLAYCMCPCTIYHVCAWMCKGCTCWCGWINVSVCVLACVCVRMHMRYSILVQVCLVMCVLHVSLAVHHFSISCVFALHLVWHELSPSVGYSISTN